MVQPIQYLPSPVDPMTRAVQGLQIGQAIRGIRQNIAAQDEADMYKRDLQDAMDRGDPNAFAKLAAKYPNQAQQIKASWQMLAPGQQQNELLAGAEAYNAIKNNQPQVAKTLLDQRISAAANAGQDTSRLESIRRALDSDPQLVTNQLDMIMYAIAPDQWSKMTGGAGEINVQRSEIYGDGTVVMIGKDGSRQVKNPEGEIVTGAEAARVIREAQQFGVRVEGEKAGRADAIKRANDIAQKTFEQIPAIEQNISTLDQVISTLDAGANTGAVAQFLPSIKAETVKLNVLRNQLGLDVIGSVTFGALSEGELRLALDTALPTGLNEAELKKWAQDKKIAQQKLLANMNERAEFLADPNNTLNDWLRYLKDQKEATKQKLKGLPPQIRNKSYMSTVTGNP